MSIIMNNVKAIQYNNKTLKKIEYNGNVIWSASSNKRFSQLDYIDIAAGSYCDLNSGIITTSGTEIAYTGKFIYYAIDAIFNVDNTPLSSGQSQLFGALVNSGGYQRYHMFYTSAGNTVAYSGTNTQTVMTGIDLTQRHLFELNGTGNKVYVDSVDQGTFLPPTFTFTSFALNGRWFDPNYQASAFKGRYYGIDKKYISDQGAVSSMYLNKFVPAIDHANNDAVVLVQIYKDFNSNMQFYKVHNIVGTATAGTVVDNNPSWSPDL